MKHLRIKLATLKDAISDAQKRQLMAMSTLISSDQLLIETTWDGSAIGDLQVFLNEATGPNGQRLVNRVDGKDVPVADKWVWWTGVPRENVKNYRFADEEILEPQTVNPFHAQPKQEPASPSKGSGATGARS